MLGEGYLGGVWVIGEGVGAAEHVPTIVRHISRLRVSLLHHKDEISAGKEC